MAKMTRDRVDELQNQLTEAQNAYLREAGWRMTNQNPASLWLWSKDGMQVSRHTALVIERHSEWSQGTVGEGD